MQANGVRLLIEGERVAKVRCASDPRELGPQDYVFITLKAHQVPGVVDLMQPLLGPDTAVVTGVNGIPIGTSISTAASSRGARWKASIPAPANGMGWARARHRLCAVSSRRNHRAGRDQACLWQEIPDREPDGTRSERVTRLAEMMARADMDAPVRDNIRDEIWLKLWGNLCFNPISALTHATLDIITSDPATRALSRQMMLEAKHIAELRRAFPGRRRTSHRRCRCGWRPQDVDAAGPGGGQGDGNRPAADGGAGDGPNDRAADTDDRRGARTDQAA
jgi:2-dehydropantoate 2-reductase